MGQGTYHTPPGCSQSTELVTICGHGGQVRDPCRSSQAFMTVTEDRSGHSVLLQRRLSGNAGRPSRNSPHSLTFQPARPPFGRAVCLLVIFGLPPCVRLSAPLRGSCVSAGLVLFSLSPAPPHVLSPYSLPDSTESGWSRLQGQGGAKSHFSVRW